MTHANDAVRSVIAGWFFMLAVGAIDMVTGDTWGTLKLLDDHCDFGRGCIQYTRDYDEMTDRSKVRRRYARPPPAMGGSAKEVTAKNMLAV